MTELVAKLELTMFFFLCSNLGLFCFNLNMLSLVTARAWSRACCYSGIALIERTLVLVELFSLLLRLGFAKQRLFDLRMRPFCD